jgi:hypothetical protein
MAIAAMGLFAGCSTSSIIVNEWRNPAYVAPEFKSIMVGGFSEQTSIGRSFEDEFLVQLKAAGVDAVPSYRYIPENERITEAMLQQAARQAGADALIIARSVKVEQKTDYGPSYPTPSIGVWGSNVGAVWQGPYGAALYYALHRIYFRGDAL